MTVGELIRDRDIAAKAYERAQQRFTAANSARRKSRDDQLVDARYEVAKRWLADAAERLAVLQFEVDDAAPEAEQ